MKKMIVLVMLVMLAVAGCVEANIAGEDQDQSQVTTPTGPEPVE
jgi:hypothetical protein